MQRCIRLLPPVLLAITAPASAEIRYIPLEEAESTRLCVMFTDRLEEAEKQLRLATVAGGSALGKTPAETNAIRTKLKFEKDYYRRKAEAACAEEAAIKAKKSGGKADPNEQQADRGNHQLTGDESAATQTD